MHFDIIVPADTAFTTVLSYGGEYLRGRQPENAVIMGKDCRFCHITEIIPRWEQQIGRQGYYIHELQGCH